MVRDEIRANTWNVAAFSERGNVMKFKTEEALWLWLAKKWDKPVLSDASFAKVMIQIGDSRCFGLCGSLSAIDDSPIEQRARDRLLKITATIQPGRGAYPFLFPKTAAGAKKRAALCRKFAAEARAEAKKKRKR
jgi:hypothetical protein